MLYHMLETSRTEACHQSPGTNRCWLCDQLVYMAHGRGHPRLRKARPRV